MTEGEFKKRSWSMADVESLIMSRWKERWVNLELIEEARKDFPMKRDTAIFDKDATISLHLEWSKKILEWYVKWLGQDE